MSSSCVKQRRTRLWLCRRVRGVHDPSESFFPSIFPLGGGVFCFPRWSCYGTFMRDLVSREFSMSEVSMSFCRSCLSLIIMLCLSHSCSDFPCCSPLPRSACMFIDDNAVFIVSFPHSYGCRIER